MIPVVTSSEFLKIFIWVFAGLVLPFLLLFGFVGVLYTCILSIILTPLIMYITTKLGKAAGRLYCGSSSKKSERDLLLLELEKIKINHGRRKYDEALKEINFFNKSNPDIPEALYLKAHILWDGFHDKTKAISCLQKVLACSEPGSDYYIWALNFRNELKAYEDAESTK